MMGRVQPLPAPSTRCTRQAGAPAARPRSGRGGGAGADGLRRSTAEPAPGQSVDCFAARLSAFSISRRFSTVTAVARMAHDPSALTLSTRVRP